jgi:uncharacterized repeat protein (TIGR01451 family)
MKREKNKFKWKTCFTGMAVVFMAATLLMSGPAMAADNIGTGDIAGDNAALNSSNIFQLFTTTMSLNKMAFLANGTQLASGATLPRGTEVRFVIYIDNTTAVPMNDVSIQDILDPTFAYQAGSMMVDNSAANAATPGEIYAAVNAGTAVLDPIGADVASAVGVTIDVGNQNVANGQLDLAANRVWAILFRTLMQ